MMSDATGTIEQDTNWFENYQNRWKTYNRVRRTLLKAYFRLYHRLEVIGGKNVPEGASLVAAPHGGAFDLDIIALSDFGLKDRQIQALIVDDWHFINNAWGRYWVGSGIPVPTRGGIRYEFIDPFFKKGGRYYPSPLAIFPEGHSGLYSKRRIIDVFYPGVVRLAIRYRVPIVPTAMVGFREASPILTEKFMDHGPNMPIVFLPPLPLKLKIEFGLPFELDKFYGCTLSKQEEYWIANHIVRPKVAEIMAKHQKVELAHIDVKMSEPKHC